MSSQELVTVGVDTHTDVHVAAVLDQAGRLLETASFPATTRGYAQLATWAESFGDVDKVGMEGTGSFGAGLLRFLAEYGLTVVEVDRPDRSARRRNGKSDPLDHATGRLDGKNAAASTARRHRTILANAMDYAIELGLFETNPIRALKWTAPKASGQVDRRSVVNPRQARALLAAVRAQEPSGPRLVAFFAVMYYAGLRPEEAINLRVDDVVLSSLWEPDAQDDAWGELHLRSAAPDAGGDWTDDGSARERRQLKHRADGDSRIVPVHPELARLLRDHLEQVGAAPDGRLFHGVRGGEMPTITYRRAWIKARQTAFTASEQASPLARRPYDLRHACLSTWLNGGVYPTQVAEWAGHGVDVLLRIYAKCVVGQNELAKRRISEALRQA